MPMVFPLHISTVVLGAASILQGVEGLIFGDDLRLVAPGKDVNQVMKKLDAWVVESM